MLIRKGAAAVCSAAALREALGFQETANRQLTTDNLTNCSPEEIKILKILSTPMSREELIDSSDMPLTKLNTIISVLEIKKLIREEMGEIQLN